MPSTLSSVPQPTSCGQDFLDIQVHVSYTYTHIKEVPINYNDPRAGKEIELPSGYGNAKANNLGDYAVSPLITSDFPL